MKWFSSLRFRILSLVLMTVAPTLIALFYLSHEQERRSIAELRKESLQNTKLLSGLIEQKVEGARSLLIALSHNPAIQNRDSASCNKILAHILEHNPQYTNLGAADPDGNVYCSARPMIQPVNASDKPWFQRTVKSRDIAVGDYQIGRIIGEPVIIMGHAARDESGKVQSVVFVPFDLAKLSKIPEQASLPRDRVFLLLDRNGTILSRSPDHGKWVAKIVSESPLIKTIMSWQEGIADIEGVDGIKRIYSFTAVAGTDKSIFVSTGIPKEIALADINRQFTRNLTLLGLIAFLSFAAALIIGRLARQSEEKLLKSEEQFRETFYRAGVGKIQVDPVSGCVLRVNPAFCEFIGYSEAELQEKTSAEITLPEDRELDAQLFRRLLQREIPTFVREKRYVRRDGAVVWGNVSATMLFDDKGQASMATAVIQDITGRKQTEKALQESEERLRLSTELANVAVWDYSFITNSMSRSNNHDRLYGLEWQTKWDINTFFKATHPDDREFSNGIIQKSVAPGGPDQYIFDFRVVYPDQSIHWLMVTGQVIDRNSEGQGTIVRGCLMDITNRKRAEDDLRESEAKFSAAFQGSPVALAILTLDGEFVDANRSFCKLVGYSCEDVIGKAIIDLGIISAEYREKLVAAIVSGGGSINNAEVKFHLQDGSFRDILYSTETISFHGMLHRLSTGIDITERKQAEEALRESEVKYRRLHESMTDCFGQTTMSGEIVAVNRSYLEMLGYNEDEVRALRYQDVTPARWHEFEAKILDEQVLPRGYSDVYEKEYIRKDGTVFPVELKTYLLRDDDGKPSGMWAIVRDITKRKQAERIIQERERQLSTLISNLPGMVYRCRNDKDYTTEFVSDGVLDLTGYPASDFQEQRRQIEMLILPEDQKWVWTEIQTALDEKRPFILTYRIITANGGQKWVWERGRGIYDANGELQALEGFATDITERKRAEEELRKYRDHLEYLVKERTVELEEAQEALVSIVEDVNEKSAQLARAMAQAQSADRLKSAFLATMSHELRTPLNSIIGFTGIVLQGMSGPLNEEQAKQLGMVKSSANHLLSLINDVLDISRIEAGQIQITRKSFDVRSVIETALRTVLPLAAKKGLSLDSAIASDAGTIESDRRRVEQILINLVGNAVKFTERGTVRIAARRVTIPAPSSVIPAKAGIQEENVGGVSPELVEGRNAPEETVRHDAPYRPKTQNSALHHGDFLEISVADTGIGIKPEDMDMIFKPFSQIETGLTRNHEGTGLGLSICGKLVEMLEGTIRVESVWGKGSTFIFALPLSYREGQ